MKSPPKSLVWTVWVIVMVIYAVINTLSVLKQDSPNPTILFGWGIIMPVLTNLAWWAIAFRMRFYFPIWWIWGIATTPVVAVAGFLTMVVLTKGV